MNICDMYNKIHETTDYIFGFKRQHNPVQKIELINVLISIIGFVGVIILISWWYMPLKYLLGYEFKSSKYVLIYKKMYCRTIKISELSKWKADGWEPKAIFR